MASGEKVCPVCGGPPDGQAAFCLADGAVLLDREVVDRCGKDPHLGQLIASKFRVVDRLGAGAMGVVYLCRQVGLNRPVALKLIDPRIASDPTFIARFEREARLVSRLSGEHTASVFDFGRTAEGFYLAMEFVPGETLRARLDRENVLAVGDALEIMDQILAALAEAHAAGIVHRDIKPENVQLTPKNGRIGVKVLDFGVAKPVGEKDPLESHLTRAGAMVGTPVYMSPEQAEMRAATPASDLYSAGVVLFEMLAGSPPFMADKPILILGMHVRARVPKLVERRRDAPPAVTAVIERLLAKAPED